MKNCFGFILIFIFNQLIGQNFTDLQGDYLGQEPPGDVPVVFAPKLISSPYLEHSAAIFSDDGNTVVWCSIRDGIKNFYQMKRINNRWTQPQLLDFFNDGGSISMDGPFFVPHTKRLYFNSGRIRKNQSDKKWIKGKNRMWFVDQLADGWSNPEEFKALGDADLKQVSITQNGSIFFLGFTKGSMNNFGLHYSLFKDGKYQQPQLMPFEISPDFQNWTPFIAVDGSYLIYSKCIDLGDYGDLLISYYDEKLDRWSKPQNLGSPINTATQERFPVVSPDGKYLFFTRSTLMNSQDIFWVKSDIIQQLKATAEY